MHALDEFCSGKLLACLQVCPKLKDKLDSGGPQNAHQHRPTEERLLGQVLGQLVVCASPRLKDAKWYQDSNVNVKELVIGQVAGVQVEH